MSDELDDAGPTRSLGEYWAMAKRRRWWIVLPPFLCWALLWGASWLLSPTYESEALIAVEQQKVPDKFVAPNVNVDLQNRVQSITQQILSRTRLQETIDRHRLYSKPHGLYALLKSGAPIDRIRSDIKVDLVETPGRPGDFSAFKIRYSATSPQLARDVNSDLTSLFIEESARSQQELSENTEAFLESQLAEARAKMQEQEAQVASFKARHVGELPGQLESNVQILDGLQGQLQATQHALDASKQQAMYLQSLLQQYQSAQSSGAPLTSVGKLDTELEDLRFRLQDLRSRYTDTYPDVVALNNKIAETEKLKRLTESFSTQPVAATQTDTDRSITDNGQRSSAAVMQIQSQLRANQLEIRSELQHEEDLQSQVATYQARLNKTPETEQLQADVSRGYEESKSNYDSLLQKQMQSQLATRLEERQQGQQFRVIDPPSLPDKPSAPNRLQLSLAGFGLGIGLGLALAVALETTDVRVRQKKDLEQLVPACLLVGIPRLDTPEENRLRLRTAYQEVGVAVVMVLLFLAGNVYVLYKG